MIVKLNNLNLNVSYHSVDIPTKTPVLFLHGFTGSLSDWDFINGKLHNKFTPIFIDLIGHGNSDSPNEVFKYSEKSQLETINELLNTLSIDDVIIVGYSMGGRLALSFSINYPQKVKGLVLESSSYGIEDYNEREERVYNDESLANKLENEGLNKFINYWINIPLFDSIKKMKSSTISNLKERKIKSNNVIGLKNSLLGFSTGNMKYFGNLLPKLKQKVLLIAGELDLKYCEIAKDMNEQLSNSDLKIVNDCGHNVHFEKPEEFLKLLNTFLLNIRDEK